MKNTTVKIGDFEFKIKRSYRALMMIEDYKKTSSLILEDSVTNLLLSFYCVVKANNKLELSFDEFVDLIDNTESDGVEVFSNFITDTNPSEIDDTPKKKQKLK